MTIDDMAREIPALKESIAELDRRIASIELFAQGYEERIAGLEARSNPPNALREIPAEEHVAP